MIEKDLAHNAASMSPPVRVELTRERLESAHLVDVVVRTREDLLSYWGEPTREVLARSSLKPIQVLPLLTSGAADAFDVTDTEIALAAASHSSEDPQVEAVAAWLARIGLGADALECGPGRPLSLRQSDLLIARGTTLQPIHNCCSGKHAGFLTIARHLDVDPRGYSDRDHPVQRLVTAAIEEWSGVTIHDQASGVDGCGIPTFALPLDALAGSMARLVDPVDLDKPLREAAARVVDSLSKNPYWVSGTDRREVELTEGASEPLVIKTGAEGVFMAALPERGIGIALKVRDGAVRAADLAIAAVLESLGVIPSGHAGAPVTNAAGTVVGTMQAHLP